MTKRMNREDRYELLLGAAMELANEVGYSNITREALCDRAGVSRALVNSYFPGGIDEVKQAVVDKGIATRDGRIVAEAVLFRHPAVAHIKAKLRDLVIGALYPAKR